MTETECEYCKNRIYCKDCGDCKEIINGCNVIGEQHE